MRVLLAALVFGLGILTAATSAHAGLHEDSDHPDHECAITLFAQGAEPLELAEFSIGRHAPSVSETQDAPESAGFAKPAHLTPPIAGPPVA